SRLSGSKRPSSPRASWRGRGGCEPRRRNGRNGCRHWRRPPAPASARACSLSRACPIPVEGAPALPPLAAQEIDEYRRQEALLGLPVLEGDVEVHAVLGQHLAVFAV